MGLWPTISSREQIGLTNSSGKHLSVRNSLAGTIAANLVLRKQDRQHSGLLDGYGEAYPLLREVLEACTGEMYGIANNSTR